jgi:hypothetical protein
MKPQVSESSIDRLIARTLEEDMSAAQAVLAAASPLNAQLAFDHTTVHQQVRHRSTHGTADLVLHLRRKGRLQALILIENKIDAVFTPDQPERYRICRDAHITARSAPVVATLLVSPSIYIAGSRLKEAFDGTLPYEHLLAFVNKTNRAMLESAIERASSPYEPVPVEAVISFFDGYTKIVAETYPDLRIKTNPNSGNARPEASRTIYFDARASGFRRYPFLLKGDKPASFRVSHQCWDSSAPSASVKLMLDGWANRLAAAAPILQPELRGTGLYLRSAGRSLALVADTTRLNNMRSASTQRAAIEQALHQLRLIRDVWNRMEAVLAQTAAVVGG